MNRAEFRRQGKENAKRNKVYTLTQAQINKIREDAREDALQEATDTSFSLMLSIPAYALQEDYWTKTATKRIPEFLDKCLDIYKDIGAGRILMSDIIKNVEEVGKLKMDCFERVKRIREKNS